MPIEIISKTLPEARIIPFIIPGIRGPNIMKTIPHTLLGLGMLMLAEISAYAQQPVGDIRRVYEDNRKVASTRRAVISSRGNLFFARQGDVLRLEDLLKLESGLLLGLYIDGFGTRGRYSFASELGGIDAVVTDTLSREGIYEIGPDPRRLKGLEFVLRKGQLFFQQLAGGVSVRAGGTIAHVDGTEALVVVGADTTRGLLYLKEGHVRFPDYPDLGVGDNQLWRLRAGQPPQPLALGVASLDAWRRLADFHRKYLSPKPFWQKPSFFLPAAAVVIGGAVLLFSGGSGDGGPDTADGTVFIPLPN